MEVNGAQWELQYWMKDHILERVVVGRNQLLLDTALKQRNCGGKISPAISFPIFVSSAGPFYWCNATKIQPANVPRRFSVNTVKSKICLHNLESVLSLPVLVCFIGMPLLVMRNYLACCLKIMSSFH